MDHSSISLREYLTERLDAQDRKLEQIHGEVRITNGRVTRMETAVAVLQDRASQQGQAQQAEDAPRRRPKRDMALGGGLGTGLAAFLWYLWEKTHK